MNVTRYMKRDYDYLFDRVTMDKEVTKWQMQIHDDPDKLSHEKRLVRLNDGNKAVVVVAEIWERDLIERGLGDELAYEYRWGSLIIPFEKSDEARGAYLPTKSEHDGIKSHKDIWETGRSVWRSAADWLDEYNANNG